MTGWLQDVRQAHPERRHRGDASTRLRSLSMKHLAFPRPAHSPPAPHSSARMALTLPIQWQGPAPRPRQDTFSSLGQGPACVGRALNGLVKASHLSGCRSEQQRRGSSLAPRFKPSGRRRTSSARPCQEPPAGGSTRVRLSRLEPPYRKRCALSSRARVSRRHRGMHRSARRVGTPPTRFRRGRKANVFVRPSDPHGPSASGSRGCVLTGAARFERRHPRTAGNPLVPVAARPRARSPSVCVRPSARMGSPSKRGGGHIRTHALLARGRSPQRPAATALLYGCGG